jgi:hypothetical protein
MAVLMFIDGVLRHTNTNAPIPNGMLLYHTLKEHNKVFLLAEDKDKADHWLRQHKITKVDDIIGEVPMPGEFPAFRQVEWVRSQGPVDYVITPDPNLTKRLLEIGVTTLVFMNPTYIREEFRPDSKVGIRKWNEIVEEIVQQQEAFIEDGRIK